MAIGRPKPAKPIKIQSIQLVREDAELLNVVLKSVNVSMSSYVSAYVSEVANAIRACGITKDTMKEFKLGEIQQVFEKVQLVLTHEKEELARLEQEVLPGVKVKP